MPFPSVPFFGFYYEHVLHKALPAARLVKTRKVQRLPDVVTVAEAAALFRATRVVSYRVLYFTLYSLGLRLGEGLRLKVGDIDATRMRVHVRDAKGRKDRFVPLPRATLSVLRRFWQIHRHPVLLFPSRQGGAARAAHATAPLDRGGAQPGVPQQGTFPQRHLLSPWGSGFVSRCCQGVEIAHTI